MTYSLIKFHASKSHINTFCWVGYLGNTSNPLGLYRSNLQEAVNLPSSMASHDSFSEIGVLSMCGNDFAQCDVGGGHLKQHIYSHLASQGFFAG